MEGCTRWLLITWFSASEGPTPRFSTVRLLKHRFRKMLPELSGARSVAPQGQTLRGDVVFTAQLLVPRSRGHIREAATEASSTSATTPKAIPIGIWSAERI